MAAISETLERLKLFISTPFRSFGSARLFPDALFGVGDTLKTAYVDALVAEITSAAQGMEDMLVDEVEFGCGPASSLTSEQLELLMRTVRKNFQLASDVCVHACEVPGGLTVDYASFCKNNKMNYLEIEMLSANPLALHAERLPPSVEATVACFQVAYFTGAPRLGILLDAQLDHDDKAFRRSVREALGRRPFFVRAVGVSDKYATILRALCEEHGLAEKPPDHEEADVFTFGQPGFTGPTARRRNQIGCGVNSLSTFDGIHFKTTGDIRRYLANSTDFAAIARQL